MLFRFFVGLLEAGRDSDSQYDTDSDHTIIKLNLNPKHRIQVPVQL
jgi:hypothetical protein